jgi:hypothetical protein
MDLSSHRSQDPDKIMQRQLYRAGQNQPAQASALTASRPSSPAAAKPKPKSGSSSGQGILTPSQRRKALIGLAVAAWLLLLGSISYCLSLPDLEGLNHERMAIWQDPNLTPEQKREKFEALREKEKNLTPAQRKQMREMGRKEMTRKMNKGMFDFFKLSPEEQMAQAKKEKEEWDKRRKMWANKGWQKGGNRNGQNGGKGGGGGGPGGWGGGGGGVDRDRPEALGQSLDSRSPEARAGGLYKMRMMQQMGGGGGGPGGGR